MSWLRSPRGTKIVGTLETVPGRANINEDSFRLNDANELEFDYAGGTDIFWDDQRTVEREGQRVFVDEDGNEFPELSLELVEDEEDDDEE